jgi:hypothetical protein
LVARSSFELLQRNPKLLDEHELQCYEEAKLVIQSAAVLSRLVTVDYFTDEIALYCAGVDWDMIKLFYKQLDNPLKKYMDGVKERLSQQYGAQPNYTGCDKDAVVARYMGFVTFAKRWPKAERFSERF